MIIHDHGSLSDYLAGVLRPNVILRLYSLLHFFILFMASASEQEIETLTRDKNTVKSPHDVNFYKNFKLSHTSIEGMNTF